jgi:hypothetical protein
MGKYKLDDIVWVMFRNGEKIGYVPAKGIVDARVEGRKNLVADKEYGVAIAPSIYHNYDEHEMFPTMEALFDHLKQHVIDR